MQVTHLKAKIHRATVTDANLEYEGSITIDSALLDAAQIRAFERVEVYNVSNGERLATYAIPGEPGEICLNGAAAWKMRPNDVVIIASYCILDEAEASTFKPKLVFVGPKNEIRSVTLGESGIH